MGIVSVKTFIVSMIRYFNKAYCDCQGWRNIVALFNFAAAEAF